jgi:DNA-binding MarR family transcriptional regulator
MAIIHPMTKASKKDGVSAAQIMMQLERLARLIRSTSHVAGLYPVQWEALRYLARANRFSNSPHALARYLGSTKGTISQTVAVLIKKNLVEKTKRESDSRSIDLHLTSFGRAMLAKDPLQPFEKTIAELGDKTAKRFSKGVAEILQLEVQRQKEQSFGTCETCHFLRKKDNSESFTCKKFEAALQADELKLICLEHASSD